MKHLKYLLFLLTFLFITPIVHAESLTGSITYYEQTGNYVNGNGINSGYSEYLENPTTNFPTQTYINISPLDYTGYIVYGIKEMLVSANYNFQTGKTYTIKLTFDCGSYMDLSSVLYGVTNNRNITYVSNGSANISWVDNSIDGKWQRIATILFVPSQTTSSVTFSIGTISTSGNAVMFNNNNQYPQGVRLSASTIEASAGNEDIIINNNQNTQDIINNNNQNTQDIINNQNSNQEQTNEGLNDINNSINDDSPPNTENFLDNLDVEPSSNPISDLLLMPLNLLNHFISGFDTGCQRYSFGYLYGHELYLPCIDLESILGTNLWRIIDALFSIFLVYEIAMLCVYIFESLTSLEDPMLSLYSPRHADTGYKPKHGGGD